MLADLTVLSAENLRLLLEEENRHFTAALASGNSFDELKLIRLYIRRIAEEMSTRKSPG
jgi:hypothetical protein